jgi:hypothetical protein
MIELLLTITIILLQQTTYLAKVLSRGGNTLKRLKISPIDTEHDCYWSNRIYQAELRKEEETPLLQLQISSRIHLRGDSCTAQKTRDTCAENSQLELKESRKPLSQCGWCVKGEQKMCAPCSQVRSKEIEGYTCAPNTNSCHHPSDAESRGISAKPKVEEKPKQPPKPDNTKPCDTAPGADPCELSEAQKQGKLSIGVNIPPPEKQIDPKFPTPEAAPVDADDPKAKKPKADDPVLPEERESKEQNIFDEPVRYGSAVIPWNTHRFCERVVFQVAPQIPSEEISNSESPESEFTATCLGLFGNVCLTQCRTLGVLYDEASRPGANEIGGLDGNNNLWDSLEPVGGEKNKDNEQGRFDTARGIPTAGKRSGETKTYGPTFVRNKRKLAYQMTQSDCLKCLKEDDCVPDCLLDGSCNGEQDDVETEKNLDTVQ